MSRPKGRKNTVPRAPTSKLMRDMERMEVGDTLWFPADGYGHRRRAAATPTRYPQSMRGRKFSTGLWTAVGRTAGTVFLLLRIERIR